MPRQGYHLPGGTWTGKQKDSPKVAAVKELKEETGIVLSAGDCKIAFKTTVKGMEEVTFVVVKVSNVSSRVGSFIRPAAKDINDEPFSSLMALPKESLNDAINFCETYHTEWFGIGLKHAYDNGYLN